MSDTIDMFRDLKDMRQVERKVFGIRCPICIEKLPRAHPKILLHGQLCRAHKPHYRDQRAEPTSAEYNAAMEAAGEAWRQA